MARRHEPYIFRGAKIIFNYEGSQRVGEILFPPRENTEDIFMQTYIDKTEACHVQPYKSDEKLTNILTGEGMENMPLGFQMYGMV